VPFRGERPAGPRPGGPRREGAPGRPWRESGPDRPWREPTQRPVDAYRPGVAPSDLLGEGEELVAGRRPVEEAFVARRPARRLLVVPQRRQALERLVLHATSLRIPVVEVEGGSLTAVAGFDGHQGIALVVEPRTFAGLDDILARAVERGEPPFILVLDSLEDPQNVGTLLRSAEAAGVHGVLFPTHRQAPLSPAAIKASAGAVEHLLLAPVDDLAGALSDLRIRGLRIAAAEADAPLTMAQADLRGPLAVVVGSEGQGLSPAIRRRADVAVRIPMRGAIGSLNAAVAGSILLFSAVGQRDPSGEGSAPATRPATFDEIAGTTPDEAPGAAPGTPARPGRKPRKGLTTEPATPELTIDPEPAPAEEPAPAAPAAPKAPRARRKAIGAVAAEPSSELPPTAPEPARPRTKKDPAVEAGPTDEEPAPAAVAGPRRGRKKKEESSPATAAAPEADPELGDELLPGGPPPE
jgi:23S rRNA (guanosine2251-2'-O)-methyltransferase